MSDFHFSVNAEGYVDSLKLNGSANRYIRNVGAIRLLQDLALTKRTPTWDEQMKLAHYSGWGDTEAFNAIYRERDPAKDIPLNITSDEWESLRGSMGNAHFTDLRIVDSIWRGLAKTGTDRLEHLRVLDPSAGVGHFSSCMPRPLWAKTELVEIELDKLTARILALLHPTARVLAQGFENTELPNNWFDLAITNVPFGNYPIIDPAFTEKRLKSSVHDYFFARSVDLIRPGGLMVYITSRYTLDKKDSSVRSWIAKQCDLLGAVRLPEGTFRANAGTDVVTDLLVLRKRLKDELVGNTDWVDATVMPLRNRWNAEVKVWINPIYIQHPLWMLGNPAVERGMYSDEEFTLKPDEKRDVCEWLTNTLLDFIPRDCLAPKEADLRPVVIQQPPKFQYVPPEATNENRDRITAMGNVYVAAKLLLNAEIAGKPDSELDELRKQLNREYDGFIAYFGSINGTRNTRALKGHPYLPFLRALEYDYNPKTNRAHKADLFSKTTVRAGRVTTDVANAPEALLVSLDTYGTVSLRHIAELLNCDESEAAVRLKGLIFRAPQGEWLTADEYLSGDLKRKLLDARAAARMDKSFEDNLKALEEVYPKPLKPGEITARLGAVWIPGGTISAFMDFLVPGLQTEAKYLPPLGQWVLTCENTWMLHTAEASSRWGTSRCNALVLVQDALNGVMTCVYDIEPDDKRVLNKTETVAAQAVQAEIKAKFEEWVWLDAERNKSLAKLYNERFNTMRMRTFNGTHLSLPGLNKEITLMDHQKDAIWRMLQSKTTLLGHEVGLGKTLSIACAIMEMRRLGIARKGVIVVPNHLTGQWLNEILWAYPNANVLCASKDDFARANRGTFLSRIATGNWDIVIVPMSSFKLLPLSPKVMADFFRAEVNRLEEYLLELKADKSNGAAVKEVERAKKRFKAKLAEASAKQKDSSQTIVWEELGMDVLAIDEFHLFKNLYFATKMTRIAGLPNSESERAFDMFVKIRWLLAHAGRVIAATGTPVSNTLAEVYTMQRYLSLDLLEDMGLDQFDSWAKTFAEAVPSMEMTPDGAGFRMNTRFSKFVNLPELVTIWRQTLDVRKADQTSVKRPKLYGDKPATVQLAATPALKAYVENLAKRSERIHSGAVDPSIDNMLKVTGEGRKAALDLRLVVPGGADAPSAKITALVDNLFAIWQLTKDDRAAQLVFCDLATPKPKADTSPHMAKE